MPRKISIKEKKVKGKCLKHGKTSLTWLDEEFWNTVLQLIQRVKAQPKRLIAEVWGTPNSIFQAWHRDFNLLIASPKKNCRILEEAFNFEADNLLVGNVHQMCLSLFSSIRTKYRTIWALVAQIKVPNNTSNLATTTLPPTIEMKLRLAVTVLV